MPSQQTLLRLFLVGWISFAFALVDVGPISVTLLLLSSVALGVSRARLATLLTPTLLALAVSGGVAWVLAVLRFPEYAKVYTHAGQYCIGLCALAGALRMDWEREVPRLERFVVALAIVVVGYAVYQLAARRLGWPGAFLPITNQQIGSDSGFQRGYSAAASYGWSRVSAFFPEPSDLGRFLLWILCFGCVTRGRRRSLLITLSVLGVLVSQSLGGLIGLVVIWLAAGLAMGSLQRLLSGAVLGGVALGAFLLFVPDSAAGVFERLDAVVFQRGDYLEGTRRFGSLTEIGAIIGQAPLFGHGLGSIKLVAPSQVITNNIVLLLIERGFVGTLLFLLPFVWAGWRLLLASRKGTTVDRLAFLVLVVESYALLAFGALYFPPLYLALGFGLARMRATAVGVPCADGSDAEGSDRGVLGCSAAGARARSRLATGARA